MENLNRYLDHYSKIKPDSPFIKSQNQVITFKETVRQVNSLSYNLKELGSSPGKTIGIMLPNIPEFVISYYSILKTGGTVVILPTTSPPSETASFIKNSKINIMMNWAG